MTSEVTPDAVRRAQFRTAIRGLDRVEVEAYLEVVAGRIAQLEVETEKLKAKVDEAPGGDLETEFETVGREVSAILQSAREAADSLRERASLDAARWRSEAMEESESVRRDAATDAEALRRDAWVVGTELLDQAAGQAESMLANAERDVLTTMGEAEREAHRLTSGARREAEDAVRSATMDAETITTDATSRRDEIIDTANRQAAAAQERTRALEQRRDELLDELENVRSTLTRLEGSLEERRESMDLTTTDSTSVKVVHPPEDAKKNWELGETVRVVEVVDKTPEPPDTSLADEVSSAVAEANAVSQSSSEMGVAESIANDHEPATERDSPAPTETESGVGDDVGALFASLRQADPVPESSDSERATTEVVAEIGVVDWVAEREALLLPITNRALRGVKKAMSEVQNVALDNLRTDGDWRPDPKAIASDVHAELLAVWTESFSAGHTAAEQMTGEKLRRPKTPAAKGEKEFSKDLAQAVSESLDEAGDGSRERQAAASRVFRVWRSDEAERRIRDISLLGYEAGLEKSKKSVASV